MKTFVLLLVAFALVAGIAFAESRPVDLVAAQDLSHSGFFDVGTVLSTKGYEKLNVYTTVDINNGTNVQVKALALTSKTGTEYSLQDATQGEVDASYFELEQDADQNIMLQFDTNGAPYIQLQAKETSGGAVPSDITVTVNKL